MTMTCIRTYIPIGEYQREIVPKLLRRPSCESRHLSAREQTLTHRFLSLSLFTIFPSSNSKAIFLLQCRALSVIPVIRGYPQLLQLFHCYQGKTMSHLCCYFKKVKARLTGNQSICRWWQFSRATAYCNWYLLLNDESKQKSCITYIM